MTTSGDERSVEQKDQDHVLHPFSDVSTKEKEPALILDRGEGVHVYDTEGRRYLDGVAGLWCVNIGYGRPEMAQVMADQAKKLAYYSSFEDLGNAPQAELAAQIASRAPRHINHMHFGSGGTDANETIGRLMHHYFHRLGQPNKRCFISILHAYHGTGMFTQSLGGKGEDKPGFSYLDDMVHHVDFPGLYRAPPHQTPEEHLEYLATELKKKIEMLGPENVAGFFAEPITGAGGVLTSPPGYHKRMQTICREYDVLYSSDEVVTGFGRLGHFFASQELFDIEPDFIASAKGITSGYFPLGAALISEKVWDVIRQPSHDGSYFAHGITYSGHPIGCAVALKNIEILENENILENVRELGPYFQEKLKSLRELRIVGDTRGSHFMHCVEYVANQETKELFSDEVDIAKRIATHAQQQGALVRPAEHLNILSPPLIFKREEIDRLVDILYESAEAATAELIHDGHLD